jgi:hypothetical protein
MFAASDGRKCVAGQMLRARRGVRAAIWLDCFITILSGR